MDSVSCSNRIPTRRPMSRGEPDCSATPLLADELTRPRRLRRLGNTRAHTCHLVERACLWRRRVWLESEVPAGARKNEGAYGPRRLPAFACERARHFPRWNKWHRSTQLQPLRSTHVVAIVGLQHRRILSELRVADCGADRIARDWSRFIACTGGWRMAADGIPSAHARRLQHASNPLDWNARAKVWEKESRTPPPNAHRRVALKRCSSANSATCMMASHQSLRGLPRDGLCNRSIRARHLRQYRRTTLLEEAHCVPLPCRALCVSRAREEWRADAAQRGGAPPRLPELEAAARLRTQRQQQRVSGIFPRFRARRVSLANVASDRMYWRYRRRTCL